jgi:hypothetical protein
MISVPLFETRQRRYETLRFPEPAEPVENEQPLRTTRTRQRATRTRCVHGHRLDAQNLYVNPSGKRSCRRCVADSLRRSRARVDGSGRGGVLKVPVTARGSNADFA